MEQYDVIIRPLITEQGVHLANTKGAYSFEVDKRANKIDIAQAIEQIYSVKVDKVIRSCPRACWRARLNRFLFQNPGVRLEARKKSVRTLGAVA